MGSHPDTRLTARAAERVTDGAGVVTIAIGVGLTLVPGRAAAVLGIRDHRGRARALGLCELVLGPLLLAGRPRWPWMAVRSALNVGIALEYRACLRENPRLRKARIGAIAMTALTAVDGATATVLRASTDEAQLQSR